MIYVFYSMLSWRLFWTPRDTSQNYFVLAREIETPNPSLGTLFFFYLRFGQDELKHLYLPYHAPRPSHSRPTCQRPSRLLSAHRNLLLGPSSTVKRNGPFYMKT